LVISLAGNDSVYKDRYERVLRELDITKKRLQKQHEEELELEHNLKKAVEKRVSFYSICILLSQVFHGGGELIYKISSCHYVAEILIILVLNTILSITGEGAG
jgi:hypothetical protein